MSLDKNLFTLHFTQNEHNPQVVDLLDPSGTVHYRKQRVLGVEYKVELYDPISESLLITATSPSVTSKFRTLELCNPTTVVELKYTGTLSFRWGFKWEQHEFEWKREECFMVRKPDPPVLVAVTKEPAGRIKTTVVQILDYNLNRFDIEDRKGLEIVILTALLTFQDANEVHHANSTSSLNGIRQSASSFPAAAIPPPKPPKPAPKTGVDRIAEMQAYKGEYNEITVEDEGRVDDYANFCIRLLEDDAMLFVTLRSATVDQVSKVLQVVEQTKRIRHKAGIDTELHQYVLDDTRGTQHGPKRIVLDDTDNKKKKYIPPNSLVVHLSKIDMPELQPKVNGSDASKKEGKKVSPQTTASSTPQRTTSLNQSSGFASSSKYHLHKHRAASLSLPAQLSPPQIPRSPTLKRSSALPLFSTPLPSPKAWNQPGQTSLARVPSLYGSHAPPLRTLDENPDPFAQHSPHSPHSPYSSQSSNTPSWHSHQTRGPPSPQDPPLQPRRHPSQRGSSSFWNQRPISGYFDGFHNR